MTDNFNTGVLLLLGRAYRAEILALKAINDVCEHCQRPKTKEFLERLSALHAANQHQLRQFCLNLHYSPGDDVELPEPLLVLLGKRNIPERLLLSWLNQCEEQIVRLYDAIDPSYLNDAMAKSFRAMRARHDLMSKELAFLTLDSTDVLNTAAWQCHAPENKKR